jgi:cold shock protein
MKLLCAAPFDWLHLLIILKQNSFMDKQQGTVKFFNTEKGFGFIKDNNSNKEIFVHVSGLTSDIKEGDSVEFDLQEGKKGMNAVNVQVVG